MEVYSMQGHKGKTSKKEPKHWVFQTNYNGGRSYRTCITNRKLVVLVSLFRKGINVLQTWNMQIKREGKIKLMHTRQKNIPRSTNRKLSVCGSRLDNLVKDNYTRDASEFDKRMENPTHWEDDEECELLNDLDTSGDMGHNGSSDESKAYKAP
ncbi:hypothetical protein WN943_010460 [Citrus x changshan-huyou]